MDSLKIKLRRRTDSIHSLADELGIGVNMLKRLYTRGVFPDNLVGKTSGGHWRIRNADIPELRARLCLWIFWHRKGLRRLKLMTDYSPKGFCCHPRGPDYSPCYWIVKWGQEGIQSKRIEPWWDYDRRIRIRRRGAAQSISRSRDRQDELEKLYFAIIQMHGSGFIRTVDDADRWRREIIEAAKEIKQNAHEDASPPRGREINLIDLNPKQMALVLLQVNVKELNQRKRGKTITIKELAMHMRIGVSTLYRIYGKECLRESLGPDVKVVTKEEERDQAENAKYSKEFSWRKDNEADEDFFDEEASESSSDS